MSRLAYSLTTSLDGCAAAWVDTLEFAGRPCPACDAGRFARDPEFLCIS